MTYQSNRMQVTLITAAHTDGRQQMAERVETTVKDALGQFDGQVTRVEAHLSDTRAPNKSHADEVRSTLQARLAGRDVVVVKGHADNAHQATRGAVGKLQRATTIA